MRLKEQGSFFPGLFAGCFRQCVQLPHRFCRRIRKAAFFGCGIGCRRGDGGGLGALVKTDRPFRQPFGNAFAL